MSVQRKNDYEPSVVRNDNNPPKKPFHPLDAIRYIVLLTDIGIAAALWHFRVELLGDSEMTDLMAAIVAGSLVVAGFVAFFVLKLASMKR